MPFLTLKKIKNDLKNDCDIYTYISDRGGRKSSVFQEFLINEAKKGKPFLLLRSKSDEVIALSWLSEYIQKNFKNYQFEEKQIDKYMKAFYFTDDQNKKHLLCYASALSVQKKYKSNYLQGFEKIKYVLWEECIPTEPIPQNRDRILTSATKELRQLFSFVSTVTRKNKPKIIMLGNDIPDNILNPITVLFDVFEHLKLNENQSGDFSLDDKKYNYLFYYFDFPNSINHWMFSKKFDIDYNLKIPKNSKKYDFILATKNKNYYLYEMKTYFYISSKSEKKAEKTSGINNTYDFFNNFGTTNLLKKYSLTTALQFLITFYNVEEKKVIENFGLLWFSNPKFIKKKEQPQSNDLLNIYELNNMSNSELLNYKNLDKIKELRLIIRENHIIYENPTIKAEVETLTSRGVLL